MATPQKAGANKFVTLKSLRNLRPWFKDASSDDIQDVIEQLERLKREKLREEETLALKGFTKSNSAVHYHNIVKAKLSLNYEPQDILDALVDRFSCRNRSYRSVRVKYRFHDLDGKLCEWSGQGREPVKLRELLQVTGKNREDFLVTEENNSVALVLGNNTEESSFVELASAIDVLTAKQHEFYAQTNQELQTNSHHSFELNSASSDLFALTKPNELEQEIRSIEQTQTKDNLSASVQEDLATAKESSA